MQSSSILKMIPKQSIFSLLPFAQEELSDFFEVLQVTPQEEILQMWAIQDRLIIPLSDHLLLKGEGNSVHLLQKGRVLALKSLLQNSALPYSVSSQNHNTLLTLPREVFIDYLKRYPHHESYLNLMTGSAAFRSFKTFLSEKNITQEIIINLAHEFATTTLDPHGVIDGMIVLNDETVVPLILDDLEHYLVADRLPMGAWAGGFSLVGTISNPYRLKLNERTQFYTLSHLTLKRYIKNEFILESIAADHWAGVEKKKATDFWDLDKSVTPIAILESLPLPMDPEKFLRGSSDIDALPKTIFNLMTYLGVTVDFSEVDLLLRKARVHFTLSTIGEIFEANDFQTRPLVLSAYQEVSSPLLILKGNRAIAVLEKISKTEYLCMDSVIGFYKTSANSLFEFQNPKEVQALLVDRPPQINDPSESIQKVSASFILQVLAQSKRYLFLIGFCAVMTFAFNAFIPKLSQLLLDEVLRTSDNKTLAMCLIGMLVSGIGVIAFEIAKNRMANIFSLEFDQKFSAFLYKRALQLKPKDMTRIQVGGILNRISEAEKIRHFFSTESINKLISLISVAVYMVILAFYSIYIALLPLVYFIVLFLVQKIFRTRIYRFSLEHFNLGTKLNTFINDSISKILAVKAFNANRKTSVEWDQIIVKSTDASQKAGIETAKANAVVEALSQATQIGAIWLAVYLLFSQRSDFTVGELFAITQYTSHVIGPLGGLVTFIISIADVKLSLDKINDILFPTGKVEPESAKGRSVPLEGKITLDRVSFRYEPEDPWVIKDVSMTIYPGQIVALVGQSGSGKTTLANLIAGDIDPTTGKIFFDHHEKSFIDLDYLKSQIGYVQQSSELFAGSIKSNIAYKDDAPVAAMLDFAKKYSYSEQFIGQFPQGEDNFLAEGGMGLSGGQKQRISIARVIYTDPKILILDEATSALDSDSEAEIVKNIAALAKNRTTIIIAHRLSTIRDADVIFVLDGGSIAQQGSHNQLIRAEGIYKELFQDQSS